MFSSPSPPPFSAITPSSFLLLLFTCKQTTQTRKEKKEKKKEKKLAPLEEIPPPLHDEKKKEKENPQKSLISLWKPTEKSQKKKLRRQNIFPNTPFNSSVRIPPLFLHFFQIPFRFFAREWEVGPHMAKKKKCKEEEGEASANGEKQEKNKRKPEKIREKVEIWAVIFIPVVLRWHRGRLFSWFRLVGYVLRLELPFGGDWRSCFSSIFQTCKSNSTLSSRHLLLQTILTLSLH